ncbi:uncharacterized protein TNCV_3747561 [Trichonephila clavipes]|nr:uncharacterized protein TNCV_3747561 [Trichonephila clavipes]
MLWLRQQRAFAVEAYFSNGRSVIAGQCAFFRHIGIPPQSHVPDWKCVLTWNDAFRATENVSKERKRPPKTVRTPENMEGVYVLIQTGKCDNGPIFLLTHCPRKGY